MSSPDKYYLADIEKRAKEEGVSLARAQEFFEWNAWEGFFENDLEPTTDYLYPMVKSDMLEPEIGNFFGIYPGTYWGQYPQVNIIEQHVWAPAKALKIVEQWVGKEAGTNGVRPSDIEAFERED
jgi:hypothetical protein